MGVARNDPGLLFDMENPMKTKVPTALSDIFFNYGPVERASEEDLDLTAIAELLIEQIRSLGADINVHPYDLVDDYYERL